MLEQHSIYFQIVYRLIMGRKKIILYNQEGRFKTSELVKIRSSVGKSLYHSYTQTFLPNTVDSEVP